MRKSLRPPSPYEDRVLTTTESLQQQNPYNNQVLTTTESLQQLSPYDDRVLTTSESSRPPSPYDKRVLTTTESLRQASPRTTESLRTISESFRPKRVRLAPKDAIFAVFRITFALVYYNRMYTQRRLVAGRLTYFPNVDRDLRHT